MLTFDERSHTYFWRGEPIPSVTQILREVGLYPPYHAIPDAERDRKRGTLVHSLLEAYDKDELDYDTWLSMDRTMQEGRRLEPFLDTYRSFLSETGIRWSHIEHRMTAVIANQRIGGTADRIGIIGNSPCVLDIKVSRRIPPACTALQTAAYTLMHFGRNHSEVRRYALVLNPDKPQTYRLIEYTNTGDYAALEAAISLWKWIKSS